MDRYFHQSFLFSFFFFSFSQSALIKKVISKSCLQHPKTWVYPFPDINGHFEAPGIFLIMQGALHSILKVVWRCRQCGVAGTGALQAVWRCRLCRVADCAAALQTVLQHCRLCCSIAFSAALPNVMRYRLCGSADC